MDVKTLESKVDDHEERIKELEASKLEQEKLNIEIRNKLTETENTVLKESGKQLDLSQKLLDHVLKNDSSSRKAADTRKNYKQKQTWKVIGILTGSGGILYLLIENLISKLG